MHLKLKLALSLLITVIAAYLLRPVIFKVTLPFVLSSHGLGYWFGNLIYPYYPDHDPGLILAWSRDCDWYTIPIALVLWVSFWTLKLRTPK
jgi:hypothetical protein